MRRALLRAGFAAAVVLGPTSPALADECAADATSLTSLGEVFSDSQIVVPGKMARIGYTHQGQKVRYVRLLLRQVAGGGKWWIVARDSELRVIDTLSSDQMISDKGLWTRRLYVDGEVNVDLRAESPTVRLEVSRAIVMLEQAAVTYYSVQVPGAHAFRPLFSQEVDTRHRRLGDQVGFVMSSKGTKSWCCSGIAVGEDLFLTNWHCGGDARSDDPQEVWSSEVCESTFIDFSWDGDAVDREYTCVEVVDRSEIHDFALLQVRPLRGSDKLQPSKMRKSPPSADEDVRIVHHPACKIKQISFGCSVRDTAFPGWKDPAKTEFTYPCDTEGGSSGAPVFDERDRLIGMHHLGFERKNNVCDKINKAVGINDVLNAMRPKYATRVRALLED